MRGICNILSTKYSPTQDDDRQFFPVGLKCIQLLTCVKKNSIVKRRDFFPVFVTLAARVYWTNAIIHFLSRCRNPYYVQVRHPLFSRRFLFLKCSVGLWFILDHDVYWSGTLGCGRLGIPSPLDPRCILITSFCARAKAPRIKEKKTAPPFLRSGLELIESGFPI